MSISFPNSSCFIGGEWIKGTSGIEVRSPATGELVGTVPNMGSAETARAITEAAGAFATWRTTPAPQRGHLLRALAEEMRRECGELARLLTREQGKPIREAENEIHYGASFFDWFGEEARRIYGELIPSSSKEVRLAVLREPVGVTAAITPWNFPNAMVARKVAAALAAGCCSIVKPASETPLSALAIAQLGERIGIPKGVLTVITGDPEPIAGVLMESEIVRALSFTGSTEVGKLLMRQAAATVKRLTLELGGNAPFLVFEDADLDGAVKGAIFAKYRNAGQTCVCVNRMLVHDALYDEFCNRLAQESLALPCGNGLDPGIVIGPLISPQAVTKVARLVDDALSKGARLRCGTPPRTDTLVIKPIVLSDVTEAMRICQEEIFGPVSTVQRFHTEEEAIGLANATDYGLASYLYTRDLSRAVRVSEKLEYGMVGVNTPSLSYAQAPFGGIKHSGFGREGSRHGLDEYLNLKYIATALAD